MMEVQNGTTSYILPIINLINLCALISHEVPKRTE